MKIALFHELPQGGARIATNEIAKRLKNNHLVDLFYVDEEPNVEEEEHYTSAYFYKFIPKEWKGKNWKIRLFKDTIELYTLYQLHQQIARKIREGAYDVVFVNASKYIQAPFLLRFKNTKKAFYLHDPHFRNVYEDSVLQKERLNLPRRIYHTLNRAFYKVLDRQNLEGADLYIANSTYTAKIFTKTYGKESLVAPLGVTVSSLKPKSVKKEFDVLYIGSLDVLDDYLLLQDALKLSKQKVKVRAVLREEEWISKEEMAELYQKSKIVVALGRNEPLGLVPLEAMEQGVPVIAIDEGGYRETVIDNKTGFLINRSPKVLIEKISLLLQDTSLRKKFGVEAKLHVQKNWSWDKRITSLEKLLES